MQLPDVDKFVWVWNKEGLTIDQSYFTAYLNNKNKSKKNT